MSPHARPADEMSHEGPHVTSFADHYQQVQRARRTYPNKMPIVIVRHETEGEEGLGLGLPLLDKTVFLLVPRNVYVSELIKLTRNHLRIGDEQTLLLLDGRGRTACVSARVSRIYDQGMDVKDGFLYMSYASRSRDVGSLMDRLMSKFNEWAGTVLNTFPVVPEGVPHYYF